VLRIQALNRLSLLDDASRVVLPNKCTERSRTERGDHQSFPFVGLAPCRIVDTRGGAPITGGIFTGGSDVRNYATAGICGIPAFARALSLNFTITSPGQTVSGFLTAWPTGGAVPPVSILNWDHVPAQVANAAVLPTGPNVSGTTARVSAKTTRFSVPLPVTSR
jgi:hypothetical protein